MSKVYLAQPLFDRNSPDFEHLASLPTKFTLDTPGARPRHHHFDGRAVHDTAERAWLQHFLDGWLARRPVAAMAEAAE